AQDGVGTPYTTFKVSVNDDGTAPNPYSAAISVQINVDPLNDAPSFALTSAEIDADGEGTSTAISITGFPASTDINVEEDFGIGIVTVTPDSQPTDEATGGANAQTVSYTLSPDTADFATLTLVDASSDQTLTGSIDPSTTVKIRATALLNSHGAQTFTLTAQDSGSSDGNNQNIASQTFTLTVNSVNDVPSFTLASATVDDGLGGGAQQISGFGDPANPSYQSISVDEDFGTINISIVPDTPPTDEQAQTVTYSLNPTSATFASLDFVDAGGVPLLNPTTGQLTQTTGLNNVGLRLTAVPDKNQQIITFTIKAEDYGPTDDNGARVKFEQDFTIVVSSINDAPFFNLTYTPQAAATISATTTDGSNTDHTERSVLDY
ncbi:MAG: hypothetical protein QGG39_17825, partial [Candidatus Poribacteria bacterium]|nr:hypothetical protein [Candidatus Poribacteria bacterium]